MNLNKSKVKEINSKLYLESRSNPTDTIKMDIPLFIRMLEYAREDAKTDMDLHNVTEKAISLSSSGKTLTMAEYEHMVDSKLSEKKLTTAEKQKKEEIVKSMKKSFKGDKGAMYAIATSRAKKLAEVNLKASKLSSAEYQKAKKLKDFKASDWKWNTDEDLYVKVNEDKLTEANERGLMVFGRTTSDNNAIADMIDNSDFQAEWNAREGYWLFPEDESTYDELELELEREFNERGINARFEGIFEVDKPKISEAYVPDNIKSFAKRKGVSSLVNKAAGWAEKIGKRITGGTAIGKDYSTLILDMGYQTSDIYINTDDNTIELYGEEVNSFPEFKKVYMSENTKDKIEENIQDNDILGDMISDMLKYKTKEEVLQYLRQQVALYSDDVKDNKPKISTTKQKSMVENIISKLKGK
jgi:hypothetical protein